MEGLGTILAGFDKEWNISFMNRSAERLQGIVGFNRLFDILIRLLQGFIKLSVIYIGKWQIEINREASYISISSETESFLFTYDFDYVEGRQDKAAESVLILNKAHDIQHRQDIMEMNLEIKKLVNSIDHENLITEFFSNISHEFRTPLHVIMATHQLINDNVNNGRLEEIVRNNEKYTTIINKNCFRLLRLVNNLIDISKLDAGHSAVELVNIDIINFIEDVVDSVASYAEGKKLRLVFDTDAEEKIMAVDCEILERALLNLLSNAVKFTPPGGMILVNVCDKLDRLQISVRDTGIGIPQDKQQVIFERYKQLEICPDSYMTGSGIGLSLVKSLIELHMGTISVISEPMKGSEFIIELPVMLIEGSEGLYQESKDMKTFARMELSGIFGEGCDYN